MFKEAVVGKFDEFILRSRQFGKEAGLKPEGKVHFDNFIRDYKNGQEMLFCRYIHVLDGFDYESDIHGLGNLEEIKTQPILIVTNHPHAGPLKGHGQRFVINHYINQVTQKETRWLFGEDKTSPEHFMRRRFSRQSSTILIRNGDKKAKVMSAGIAVSEAIKNRDIIGINPEGDGNKTLLKANPNSATMIFLAAMYKYNIVCVATDFKNGTFFMAVDSPLDNNQIRKARIKLKSGQNGLRELLADYTMAKIAMHLPEDKRGYYSNPQEHIDAFESLVATN